MQSRQSARNRFQYRRRNFRFAQIDKLGPERVGDRLVKSAGIDEAAVDHRLRDGFAVQLRLVQNVLGLRRLEHLLLDENLGDLFVVHSRGPE